MRTRILQRQTFLLTWMNNEMSRLWPSWKKTSPVLWSRNYFCWRSYPFQTRGKSNLMNNKTFRHASLNMAFLHASFGHHELAVTAWCETVALSGAAADHICLQESLVWFCHLEENPEMRLKMMERLVTKSSESNLHYLASLGLAMWTRDCALTGVVPTRIFEYLHTNDVVNCQHSLTGMTLTCLALRAAIWNFYGYSRNALQVFLNHFSKFPILLIVFRFL